MNIFADFHARVAAILQRGRFVVEPPRESALGDLAVNAAMVFAKEAKAAFGNPRQLATEIAFALAEDPDVSQAEVAGPGFINIRLQPPVFSGVLRAALAQGLDFGRAPKVRRCARQPAGIRGPHGHARILHQ